MIPYQTSFKSTGLAKELEVQEGLKENISSISELEKGAFSDLKVYAALTALPISYWAYQIVDMATMPVEELKNYSPINMYFLMSAGVFMVGMSLTRYAFGKWLPLRKERKSLEEKLYDCADRDSQYGEDADTDCNT